ADHINPALTPDNLTIVADATYARSHFHGSISPTIAKRLSISIFLPGRQGLPRQNRPCLLIRAAWRGTRVPRPFPAGRSESTFRTRARPPYVQNVRRVCRP